MPSYITLRQNPDLLYWDCDDCDHLNIYKHHDKYQQCTHCRTVYVDTEVTITNAPHIRTIEVAL